MTSRVTEYPLALALKRTQILIDYKALMRIQ